jgi:hypothetical protein
MIINVIKYALVKPAAPTWGKQNFLFDPHGVAGPKKVLE